MALLAVAVISHNTCAHLRACLESIRSEGTVETIVVDHASTDGSIDMVRTEFPWVSLHARLENPGFGAGANLAVASCRAHYVLVLNADSLLQPGALAGLTRAFERLPRSGIVAPRLEHPDGTLQRSLHPRPSPLNLFLEFSPIWRILSRIPILRERNPFTSNHARARRVHWAKGAALAIRRSAFEEVGGFDERFFLYFEDIDLCHRMLQAGWEIRFEPDACIVHVGEASTRRNYTDALEQRFVSMKQFYIKHYSGCSRALALASVDVLVIGRWIRDHIRLRFIREPRRHRDIEQQLAAWQRLLRAPRETGSTVTGQSDGRRASSGG
jgi:GT2 family glycosyltransferase